MQGTPRRYGHCPFGALYGGEGERTPWTRRTRGRRLYQSGEAAYDILHSDSECAKRRGLPPVLLGLWPVYTPEEPTREKRMQQGRVSASRRRAVLVPLLLTLALARASNARDPDAQYELSGPHWVDRTPKYGDFAHLDEPFRSDAREFVRTLRRAGATVQVASTLRTQERQFLMYWSWKIAFKDFDPRKAPRTFHDICIEWAHKDDLGKFSVERSRLAAAAMCSEFGLEPDTDVGKPTTSRHTLGKAFD